MRAEKACAACGRTIQWRKKWERVWEEVRYCSDACRAHKPGDLDRNLEHAIVQLLRQRGAGKTLCPSEAARAVDPENWRPLMERARHAARRLVSQGLLEITQGGQVVDPSSARGPIRLRPTRKLLES